MYVDEEEYDGGAGFENEAGHDGLTFRSVVQESREEEDVSEYERRLEILLGGTRQARDKDKRMTMRNAEFVEADSPDADFSRLGVIRGIEG